MTSRDVYGKFYSVFHLLGNYEERDLELPKFAVVAIRLVISRQLRRNHSNAVTSHGRNCFVIGLRGTLGGGLSTSHATPFLKGVPNAIGVVDAFSYQLPITQEARSELRST